MNPEMKVIGISLAVTLLIFLVYQTRINRIRTARNLEIEAYREGFEKYSSAMLKGYVSACEKWEKDFRSGSENLLLVAAKRELCRRSVLALGQTSHDGVKPVTKSSKEGAA